MLDVEKRDIETYYRTVNKYKAVDMSKVQFYSSSTHLLLYNNSLLAIVGEIALTMYCTYP